MEISNNSVVDIARSCIGTPFVHQGRQEKTGLDCAGLIIHIAKKLGLDHYDVKAYPRLPYRGMLQKVLSSQNCLKPVNKSEITPGDLLLIRFTKAPQHLGIYAGENRIIHTYEEVGRVIEHRMDRLWANRVIGVYRFHG